MAISPYVQRLRDAVGSELLVLPSVAGIIYDEKGRILLVRQADGGVWSTPGGIIEPNEAPADAVVREVWEETGLHVRPTRLLGVYGGPRCVVTYPNGDRTSYVILVFECDTYGGVLRSHSDETTAATFVGAADLRTLRTSAWVSHVLPALYDRSRAAHFEGSTWRPPGDDQAG